MKNLNYIKFTNDKNNNILYVENTVVKYYIDSLAKYKSVNNITDENITQTFVSEDEIQLVEYDFMSDVFTN
jgi:hypothetical protein